MTKASMVRAGRQGEREEDALRHGWAIAGWPEMDDLNACATGGSCTPQSARRIRTVPPPSSPTGLVSSGGCGTVWATPRSAIEQDLLYSLGSLLTICSLRRNGAARRIAASAETGTDPGRRPTSLSANEWVTPDAFLENAFVAEAGFTMTVRELLAQWGASRRTSAAVAVIEGDLADRGLVTVPPSPRAGSPAPSASSGPERRPTTRRKTAPVPPRPGRRCALPSRTYCRPCAGARSSNLPNISCPTSLRE